MKSWLKGGLIGGVLGILIWLYDYDFLLNAGGANTPISDSIRIFFGGLLNIQGSSGELSTMPLSPFFSLILLIFAFLILGLVIGLLINKTKSKNGK
jgi:hypothetical protein